MRLRFIIIMCIERFTLRAADTNALVVKVNDKHQMMNDPGTKPETHRIHALSSMVLDATRYSAGFSACVIRAASPRRIWNGALLTISRIKVENR